LAKRLYSLTLCSLLTRTNHFEIGSSLLQPISLLLGTTSRNKSILASLSTSLLTSDDTPKPNLKAALQKEKYVASVQ
jgi:hypothetical protein